MPPSSRTLGAEPATSYNRVLSARNNLRHICRSCGPPMGRSWIGTYPTRRRGRLRNQIERDRVVRAQRTNERLSQDMIQVVRWQPVAGTLDRHVRGSQHVTRREVARRHQLLSHFQQGTGLARVNRLSAIAERQHDALEVADQLPHAHRLE